MMLRSQAASESSQLRRSDTFSEGGRECTYSNASACSTVCVDCSSSRALAEDGWGSDGSDDDAGDWGGNAKRRECSGLGLGGSDVSST